MKKDSEVHYPRCAMCKREIKSAHIYWIGGHAYGRGCGRVKLGLASPRMRKRSLMVQKFLFEV